MLVVLAEALPTIPMKEVLFRLAMAGLLGAIIGYERSSHGRAAGLRTTMLACLAACVASVLSEHLFHEAGNSVWRPDPARLAQGILAGMGFLGAGVVLREGKTVRGVTTAAVLWFVSVLGLTIGSGHYVLALAAWCMAMICLLVMPMVERFIAADWYGAVSVTVSDQGATDQQIRAAVAAAGATVKEIAYDIDLPNQSRTLRLAIKYKRSDLIELAERLRHELARQPGVTRVQWH